jgi:probable F420-dependent oxidoreductase
MDFGIGYFPTADAVGPGELAAFVEERGFSSLVFAEHTHIPASRESPYPGGGELPRKYTATLDLFVALTAAALATSRLRVGSGISLVIQRDPIVTAKEVASIDVLSGGRMDFGVGAGWNREEMEHHGTDPRTRMCLLAERVEAMKALWTEREATFHGEFVNFDRVLMEPKPMQRPHPPVWVGGLGPTVIDRVLAFGDAWFPNWTPDITDRAAELRARAERPVDFMAMGPPADPKVLEQLAEADTRLVSWWLPSGGYSVLEPELEKVERAIAEFHGEA